MVHHEAFLPASRGREFQARLYYNREDTALRQVSIHAHPAMEISIPGRQGTYLVGQKQYSFQPGDVFLFRSNEKHGISQLQGREEALCMGFHFFPDTFWSSIDQTLVSEFLAAFSPDRPDFENKISQDRPEAAAILSILTAIESEFDRKSLHYEHAIRAHISLLMLQLLRACPAPSKQYPQHKASHLKQVSAVMQHIDSHFSQKITLAELASLAHMSPSYLSHIFSTATGFSLWDYVTAKRLEHAKHLLLSTDRKILDIALECGFQNSVNFNKCFRNQTGTTPSEYRENNRTGSQ